MLKFSKYDDIREKKERNASFPASCQFVASWKNKLLQANPDLAAILRIFFGLIMIFGESRRWMFWTFLENVFCRDTFSKKKFRFMVARRPISPRLAKYKLSLFFLVTLPSSAAFATGFPSFAWVRPLEMCCGAVYRGGGRRLVWSDDRCPFGRERERRSSKVATAHWAVLSGAPLCFSAWPGGGPCLENRAEKGKLGKVAKGCWALVKRSEKWKRQIYHYWEMRAHRAKTLWKPVGSIWVQNIWVAFRDMGGW